jgi:hypothetical protein
MNSSKTTLILLALHLLLAATLPQVSFSLKLAEQPAFDIAAQRDEGSDAQMEEREQSGESEPEKPQNALLSSTEVLKGDKAASIELVDSTQFDRVKETIAAPEESIPAFELDASPDTLNVDAEEIAGDDSSIAKDTLPRVTEAFSEPVETLNEDLADSVNSIQDEMNLVEEENLQSTINALKQTDFILGSASEAGSLPDALSHDIGNLEEKISDSDFVKELAPAMTNTVNEVTESTAALVDLEEQDIADKVLQEATDVVRETEEQIDITVLRDILKEGQPSTLADEIIEGLGAKAIQDSVLQSLQGYDDAIDAESLLAQSIGEKVAEHDDIVGEMDLAGVTDEVPPLDDIIPEQNLMSSLSSAGSRVKQILLNQEEYHDVKIISNPKLTQEEEVHIIEQALNAEGLKDWSDDGWQVVGMDFIGIAKPQPKWEKAIVYLDLPSGAGDPPLHCKQGWQAVIDIRLDIGKVSDVGLPTLSSHECSSAIILEEPLEGGSEALPASPSTRPSFVIAETDDVVSNEIYGSAAYLNTPSFNSSVFEGMDSYVAFLLNQKWSTSPTHHMTQVGWLISSIEGCIDCGSQQIPKNSATIAFTDSSVFRNLEAHRIPLFEWEMDEELITGTWCNEDSNYTIWAQYAGKIFNHNTNISCENHDNDSKVSNSIFLENWNTAESSLWTDHLGRIEAHSAVTFRGDELKQDSNMSIWEHSTNEEQDCTGVRRSTATVQGDLTSGKTAKWINLNSVSPAC